MIPPLSQSKYESMSCHWLYASKYIQGIEEAGNVFAQRGTEIHGVIAAYIRHLVRTKQSSDYQYFDRLLEQGALPEAIDILINMKADFIINPNIVLDTEMHLALNEYFEPWDESKGVSPSYEGTLDYVQLPDEVTAEIWDWKSHYSLQEADTFQSSFYPFLLFQHYPHLEVVRFHLKFVRFGASRSVEYTRDQVPGLAAKAKAARQRQVALHNHAEEFEQALPSISPHGSEDMFEATPNRLCMFCPKLMNGCPISKINPYTTLAPKERLQFAIWAKAAVAQNTAVLKDQVHAGGQVVAEDANGEKYEAVYQRSSKSSYPLKSTYPLIQAYDVQAKPEDRIMDKLQISATQLRQPLNTQKRKGLREGVEAVKQSKPVSRFVIRGLEDDEEDEEE